MKKYYIWQFMGMYQAIWSIHRLRIYACTFILYIYYIYNISQRYQNNVFIIGPSWSDVRGFKWADASTAAVNAAVMVHVFIIC